MTYRNKSIIKQKKNSNLRRNDRMDNLKSLLPSFLKEKAFVLNT